MLARRDLMHCFIPPYILKEIVDRGTTEQRDLAIKTLRLTTSLRDQRHGIPVVASKGPVARHAALSAVQRRVYSANHTSSLPGRLMRQECDSASADLAVDEAYDGAGATFNLFADIYNRDSLDNAGMPLDSTVHYQTGYDNAFWNGYQMVYGDGDEDLPAEQRLFNRFTAAIDVIAHELTHGITQYEANLAYSGQSGALNESMSDVFGALVKQRTLGHSAAEADWIIGQGLFTYNVNAAGVRSMKAPGSAYDDPIIGKDPQPAHMDDYVDTTEDSGGVHINSGIPNRAFYLTAMELGGYAWEKAGRIWYAALCKRLSPTASFQDAADTLNTIAGEMFGANSLEQQAVRNGWAGVGVQVKTLPAPQPDSHNPGCLPSLLLWFRPKS